MTFKTFITPRYMKGLEMRGLITSTEPVKCPHCGLYAAVWRPATLNDLQIYIEENPTPTSGNIDIVASGDDYRPTHGDIYGHVASYRDGKWSMCQMNIAHACTPGDVFLGVKD